MKTQLDRNNRWFKRYFQEGRLCKMKGLLLEENPYNECRDLEAAAAWEKGWRSVEEEGE